VLGLAAWFCFIAVASRFCLSLEKSSIGHIGRRRLQGHAVKFCADVCHSS
jgi:hypothetical protein